MKQRTTGRVLPVSGTSAVLNGPDRAGRGALTVRLETGYGEDVHMSDAMSGVKVVELAGWTFVPSAGAVLADWGADVIKIEHPATGDPQRGLSVGALGTSGPGGVSFILEQPNRAKRSFAVAGQSEKGRELLLSLVKEAHGVPTTLLPA